MHRRLFVFVLAGCPVLQPGAVLSKIFGLQRAEQPPPGLTPAYCTHTRTRTRTRTRARTMHCGAGHARAWLVARRQEIAAQTSTDTFLREGRASHYFAEERLVWHRSVFLSQSNPVSGQTFTFAGGERCFYSASKCGFLHGEGALLGHSF